MTLGCGVVCSWRHPLADCHLPLPFPWTLSLHKRQCPSASHYLVSSLSLLDVFSPLYSPFLFLGRLCQRSPGNFPVSLLRVKSTQRRAALAVG